LKLPATFVPNFFSEAESSSWQFTCVVNFELDQIREVAPWSHGDKSRKSRESSLDVFRTFGLKAVSDLTCPPATVAYSEESLDHVDKVC